MKKFLVGSCDMDRWLHQNEAELSGDYFEGCLLDNFFVWTKNGSAGIYEHFLNPNASCYLVEFQRGDGMDAYDRFVERGLAYYDEIYGEE